MHELSIVMSIIDIAEAQLKTANASVIDEIELDIGELSGVEMNSFDFAWQQAVKQSVLDSSLRKINLIEGRGCCLDCRVEFTMKNLYDACPVCNGHLIEIKKGKELRVKSLIVS